MSKITTEVLQERLCNLMKENSKEHEEILKRMDEICIKLDTQFVSQKEFGPVRLIVFGLVGFLLLWAFNSIVGIVDIH
jgi:hypothetical protein